MLSKLAFSKTLIVAKTTDVFGAEAGTRLTSLNCKLIHERESYTMVFFFCAKRAVYVKTWTLTEHYVGVAELISALTQLLPPVDQWRQRKEKKGCAFGNMSK
jgi:hypothetical protein